MIFLDSIPIWIGSVTGLFCGLFFMLQQRGMTHGNRIYQYLFFIARILVLLCTGQYLLRSPLIPSILGSIGFLSMFWLVILAARAGRYEWI